MTYVQLVYGAHTCQSMAVNSIYAVGSNYGLHIQEMGGERPEAPVVFTKPATAISTGGTPLNYPQHTRCLHHEVEMVLLVGRELWQATPEAAQAAILGVGVGLDLTLRDIQSEAKAKGRPWDIAKGFRGSAPVSAFLPVDAFTNLQDLDLSLEVNQQLRQRGNTAQMLFSPGEILSYLSRFFLLRQGDLVFTGTPEGVGELLPGDVAVARLHEGADEKARLHLDIQGSLPRN